MAAASCRPRPKRTAEQLGVLESTYGGPSEFYGAFIQIAHNGQEPKCKEPAFRVLQFVHSKKEAARVQRKLSEGLAGTGNILLQLRNTPTLICKDLDRQVSADHVLPKVHQMKTDYLAYVHGLDEDFVANRRDRSEGNQEAAKARQQAFVKEYQTKGWVKFAREEYKIRDDIEIVPGMHTEAEEQSRQLNARDEAAACPAKGIEAPPAEAPAEAADDAEAGDGDDGDDVDDEFPDVPDSMRKRDQKFAAISYMLDDSDDMECLLFIHGVFATAEEAKDFTVSTLNDMVYPLPVEVVDLYTWCYPIRMAWENSAGSKRVTNLDESCAELLLDKNRKERLDAVNHNRKIKEDMSKKKDMDVQVQKELCEHMQITDEQFTAMLEHPELGTDAIIEICKIKDEPERLAKVTTALAQLA